MINFRFLIRIAIIFIFGAALIAAVFATDKIFGIISPPKVINISPENSTRDVSMDSKLIIKFDKPINRKELRHFIAPDVYGEWKFENPLIKNHFFRTAAFIPAIGFTPGTDYQIELKNIQSIGGAKNNAFHFSFKTKEAPEEQITNTGDLSPEKPEIILIDTPLDWQDHKLSCEAASLKMALASKNISVSEKEIMEKIGYDLTPRKNNIWGDPNIAFVGDIDGKICETGYGVYWDPVAKAGGNWRPSEPFTNWNLEKLTKEIKNGNPVVVWGTLPVETLNSCSWYTPEGKYIKAIKEDHVRLVIGFIGPPENPAQIILNDPLAGRIFWPASYFLKNWAAFDYSGVVVR